LPAADGVPLPPGDAKPRAVRRDLPCGFMSFVPVRCAVAISQQQMLCPIRCTECADAGGFSFSASRAPGSVWAPLLPARDVSEALDRRDERESR
jgi:hypothetical protein